MQSAAALRQSRKVNLVGMGRGRRLKQARLEEANVGGTGDNSTEDDGADGVSAGSTRDALQHRRHMLVVVAWFGWVLRVVETSPAGGNQRSAEHCRVDVE